MNNDKNTKYKMPISEIILRFFFGFLIPFLAINGLIFFIYVQCPTIKVVDTDSNEYEENKINFYVDCRIPLKDVSVTYDNKVLSYTKTNNKYSIDISDNGVYTIKATAINGAVSNYSVPVETKDSIPPKIDLDTAAITGNILMINVSDNESNINYDNLYATVDDGTKITPKVVDRELGSVQFQIDSGNKVVVHVEDEHGNYSETSFTIS